MNEGIRVRFAPSPTGYLHLGNARTALFNWLFARHNQGKFLLRIEDTDIDRHIDQAEDMIIEDLQWLGLDWDEGPDKGGEYGPYRQSDRTDIYIEHTNRLLQGEKAYFCYCTPEELETSRQNMLAKGLMPIYDGHCAHLTMEQQRKLTNEGRKPSVRFRANNAHVRVNDLIRGEVNFEEGTIGDFIIVRSDGRPAYNYAVVIDDSLMKITHVLRGEDHLPNTPRQILIYQAFGWQPPQFGHLSMILGPDRSRLSKRHGATSVVNYREQGYLPEALGNYLALLGWSSPNEEDILPLDKLIESFTLDRISKSAAIFDVAKLTWMNGHYLRSGNLTRITRLCLPYLEKAGYLSRSPKETSPELVELMIDSVRKNMSYLAQVIELTALYFEEEIIVTEDSKLWLEDPSSICVIQALADVLDAVSETFLKEVESLDLIKLVQERSSQKGKKLYMPIRIALTGKTGGPELPIIIKILGRDRCLKRVRRILNQDQYRDGSEKGHERVTRL